MSGLTWFYACGGRAFGPTTLDHLRQLAAVGELGPDAPVCRGGDQNWCRAADVPGLLPRPAPASLPPERPSVPVPRGRLLTRFLRWILGERLWPGYVAASDAANRATGVVLGVFALAILGAMAVVVIWRTVLTTPAKPTSLATPPSHLPVRVEISPAGAGGPAVVIRNTSADRPLPHLRVSVTPTEGGRVAEAGSIVGRALGPGEQMEVWAADLGGRRPAAGDVVRAWATGADDPPLEFTVNPPVAPRP